jgi:hypothetical protein
LKKNNSKTDNIIKNTELVEPENAVENDEFAESEDNPLNELNPAELDARKRDFEKEAIPHMKLLYNYALRMTGTSLKPMALCRTRPCALQVFHKFERGTNCRHGSSE